jgi:hypothetical protein
VRTVTHMPPPLSRPTRRISTLHLAAWLIVATASLPQAQAQSRARPDRASTTREPTRAAPVAAPSASEKQRAHEIEGEAVQAFNDRHFVRAAELFEQQRTLTPRSFIVHFNLACTRSLLGEFEEAEERIARAIELGFDDVHKFRLDPTLAPLRDRPFYNDLLNRWPQFLELRRQSVLDRDRSWTRGRYTEQSDDTLRIDIRTAHDETTTEQAVDDLVRVAGFLTATLFPELPVEPWHSHEPWVVVVLPSTRDFAAWKRQAVPGVSHGQSDVGGAYDHDAKRLVAKDLGPTLWHEFAHVLHFRDASRHNQRHALWITEGLGSLVETFDTIPTTTGTAGTTGTVGESASTVSIAPAPGWRLNSLKRAMDRGLLSSTQELIDLPPNRFTGSRGLRNYAHARAIMLFLLSRDQLKPFYDAYVKDFDTDPTGALALEQATGTTLEEFDADLAAWLDTLPMVAEDMNDLTATIGADLDPGTGDGPRVSGFGAATRASKNPGTDTLKLGSIISHVNGHPTRDLHELIRVLAPHAPGDAVTLTTRRGKIVTEVTTTLVAP